MCDEEKDWPGKRAKEIGVPLVLIVELLVMV